MMEEYVPIVCNSMHFVRAAAVHTTSKMECTLSFVVTNMLKIVLIVIRIIHFTKVSHYRLIDLFFQI